MGLLIPLSEAVEPVPQILGQFLQSADIASGRTVTASLQSAEILGRAIASVLQSGAMKALQRQPALHSIEIGSFTNTEVLQSADVSAGESFLIVADLISEDIFDATIIGPGGYFKSQELNGRLLVNGVEVEISRFQYQKPTGRLGALLNVKLAEPDVTQVPIGALITFDITIETDNGVSYRRVIENGKLSGRDYTMSYRSGQGGGPDDEVSFGALDVITDKFTLAPRRSVVMYDPRKVKYDDVQVRARDAVLDEKGKPIMPIIEPVYGLTMKQILQRAYTDKGGFDMMTLMNPTELLQMTQRVFAMMNSKETDQKGCGFANVITNIPDYKVSAAHFTLENGWHSGAQPSIGMYGPYPYVENNNLYLIDVEHPLPAGLTARTVYLDKRLSETVPSKPDANAVLLTYQVRNDDDDDLLTREVQETPEIVPDGKYGRVGYTETTTRTTVREKYYADAPDDVVTAYPIKIVVETRAQLPVFDSITGEVVGVSGLKLTHRETHQDFYKDDLKTGHDHLVEGLIIDGPDASLVLRELVREKNYITWIDNPVNPGEKVQARNYTEVTGLCYLDVNGPKVMRYNWQTDATEEFTLHVPALVAQSSGLISSNDFSMQLIKTTSEYLRHKRGNQYDVSITEIDYLNGGQPKRSTAQPRTGSTASDPYYVRSKTRLFRDLDSELLIGPRIPVSVNSGELPNDRSFSLAQRILNRLKNPLFTQSYDLIGVDFAIQRGSVIRGIYRDGSYTSNYLVTGFSITGENLGRRGHRVTMSFEGQELPS